MLLASCSVNLLCYRTVLGGVGIDREDVLRVDDDATRIRSLRTRSGPHCFIRCQLLEEASRHSVVIVNKPVRDPKRLKTSSSTSSGSTPLLDFEQAERNRWAARLEAI